MEKIVKKKQSEARRWRKGRSYRGSMCGRNSQNHPNKPLMNRHVSNRPSSTQAERKGRLWTCSGPTTDGKPQNIARQRERRESTQKKETARGDLDWDQRGGMSGKNRKKKGRLEKRGEEKTEEYLGSPIPAMPPVVTPQVQAKMKDNRTETRES